MLVLYKVVNKNYESPIASEEYCLKYEIGKWVKAPEGRLFCFRRYEDAFRWKQNVSEGDSSYRILKCYARQNETVYEMETSYFADWDALQRFYSDDLEEWEKRYVASKNGMAFPLRIKPVAEME